MYDFSPKVKAWISPQDVETQALEQLHNLSSHPFLYKHVAVMPDCHLGKGATIGSVIATDGAIIPAAVGVDIGCGMIAVETSLNSSALPDNLDELHHSIGRSIPCGPGGNNQKQTDTAEERIHRLHISMSDRVDTDRLCKKWTMQLGSLGGGNHFIEVCLDERDVVWVVLHSGSRGVGNILANQHIKVAKGIMNTYRISLADQDLAYLVEGTPEFDGYMSDLIWCQSYALANREEMMDRVMKDLRYFLKLSSLTALERQRINCHHNFTQKENHFKKNVWLTRKGAIQMRKDMLGVIPGSMGTSSYIVRGIGNPMAFDSAPHGAGRAMSRRKAREKFTQDDLVEAMKGITASTREALVDEHPGAYKDIDKVIANSSELVTVEHKLRQILNVKGD